MPGNFDRQAAARIPHLLLGGPPRTAVFCYNDPHYHMRRDSDAHPIWINGLPQSRMVYPKSVAHRIRYYFWVVYAPYHRHVRDGAIALKIIKNHGRQPFLLGRVAPGVSIEEIVARLVERDYAYHRVAWEDDGEVVSLRHVKDFIFQYHIRIFEDREVRAHYEYTPECYPLAHLLNSGFEARTDEFLALIGDMIVPAQADASEFRLEILPFVQKIWK